jgi:uncharacterized protein (TIGR02246 family)
MHRLLVVPAAAVILTVGYIAILRPDAEPPLTAAVMPSPEEEIRAKRERFNQAIAARDTAALAVIWTPDVRVIGSTGARIDGRDAYRLRFAVYFADRAEYSYRREPERITVYEPWDVAAEHGRWRARWRAADGPIDVGGEYIIHWTRTDGGWFVHAEMFAPPDHCTGGTYCAARP